MMLLTFCGRLVDRVDESTESSAAFAVDEWQEDVENP